MTSRSRRIAAAVLTGLLFTALSGCNTMRGFGKDVETVGESIQRKSAK